MTLGPPNDGYAHPVSRLCATGHLFASIGGSWFDIFDLRQARRVLSVNFEAPSEQEVLDLAYSPRGDLIVVAWQDAILFVPLSVQQQ